MAHKNIAQMTSQNDLDSSLKLLRLLSHTEAGGGQGVETGLGNTFFWQSKPKKKKTNPSVGLAVKSKLVRNLRRAFANRKMIEVLEYFSS